MAALPTAMHAAALSFDAPRPVTGPAPTGPSATGPSTGAPAPAGDAFARRADERALVARAVAGDPAAERALYDAHVGRVYRVAYRLAGDDDLARDITQDVFVRAFDRLAEFRHDAAFATWLHRIALSVALNALDKVRRLRQRETPLEDDFDAAAPERRADPDLRARLAAAIDALPPGYRAVFLLHDLEGYTHEEIGEALGVRPGTSKAQLFHARARLRERLADFRRPD